MKKLFYILLFVLIGGCIPEPIDVELEEYEPKIVVASQVIPNYVMAIGLTRSFTVLSEAGFSGSGDSSTFNQVLVDSALVVITSANGTDTLEKLAPGLYVSINELELPGGSYYLEVLDYDLNEKATATSTMLENVPFDTVTVEKFETENDTIVAVNVEFTDIPNINNYYVLSIYSRNTNENALDVNMFFDNGSNRIEYQELITDKNVDGLKIIKNINLPTVSFQDSLVVSLSNISKGYHEFLTSRERSGNLLAEITNEPINYPSNVNNGLGYFNTHYPSIKFFDLKDLDNE